MIKAIKNEIEKKALLSDMVNFKRALSVSAIGWVEYFSLMLVELPTAWFVINEPLKDEFADLWIEGYGRWKHSGGRTGAHNRLGMAYAWWALHEVKGLDEIHLSDSPDFRGVMTTPANMHGTPTRVSVRGDIGKCTPVAMLFSLRSLSFHDVWISVLDWETQIFIQFGYSPGRFISYRIDSLVSGIDDHFQAMKDIFFCEGCDEWSITEDSRERFMASWKLEGKHAGYQADETDCASA